METKKEIYAYSASGSEYLSDAFDSIEECLTHADIQRHQQNDQDVADIFKDNDGNEIIKIHTCKLWEDEFPYLISWFSDTVSDYLEHEFAHEVVADMVQMIYSHHSDIFLDGINAESNEYMDKKYYTKFLEMANTIISSETDTDDEKKEKLKLLFKMILEKYDLLPNQVTKKVIGEYDLKKKEWLWKIMD